MERRKSSCYKICYRIYLSELREKVGLSQNEVARRMGMLCNNYNQFEDGKYGFNMDIRFFMKLALVLQVDFLTLAELERRYRDEVDRENGIEIRYKL